MRMLLLAGVMAASLAAAEDLSPVTVPAAEPPKCEKATRTLFWPDQANYDARAALRLAREGKLLICTRDTWRYKWRAVTMNLRVAIERQKEKR